MSRPERHLTELLGDYPKLSRAVEDLYGMKHGRDTAWPDDVLLPFGAWMAIEGAYHPDTDPNVMEPTDGLIRGLSNTQRLAAVATWRYSKGVYRFGEALYEALVKTPLPDTIPMRMFRRLPDWCPYIELPRPAGGVWGYYCYLDHDRRSGAWELRITPDTDSDIWITVPIELTDGLGIRDAIATFAEEGMGGDVGLKRILDETDDAKTDLANVAHPALSLLLYLCQDAPEIDDEREPGISPSRQQPKRVKGFYRLFEPAKTRSWEVGMKLSQSISEMPAPGSKKAPHIRRAHWHGYWTGPRRDADGRKFIYHWQPPTAVAVNDTEVI